jgi:hypothetical protein
MIANHAQSELPEGLKALANMALHSSMLIVSMPAARGAA